MKLYYSRGACSLAVHIALHETAIPFVAERVDSKTKVMDGGGDFRTINPNGYVPVLQLDSGELLTEVGAVLQYVADQKPELGLAPPCGSLGRYRLMEWLSFISSELHKNFSPLFAPNTPEEYKVIARQRLDQRYAYVERQLAGKPFLLGDRFTVADAFLFVATNWARVMNVDLTPHANLRQFQERVAQRPAVQAAMQAEGLLKK